MVAKNKSVLVIGLACLLAMNSAISQESTSTASQIDPLSFQLGKLSAFTEMVNVGLKKLALSAAVSPQEMDAMVGDAERIANEYGVELYRETDLIVTDLFPATVAEGKDVLLIYQGETLDEYMALKARKAELIASGQYSGSAREQIAWSFGKMLSYPDAKISRLIEGNMAQ